MIYKRKLRKYADGGELPANPIVDAITGKTAQNNYKSYAIPIPFVQPKTQVKVKDTRSISATTGKKIDPNKDLVTGNYNTDRISHIIESAKRYNVDPYTLLAMDLQETGLGQGKRILRDRKGIPEDSNIPVDVGHLLDSGRGFSIPSKISSKFLYKDALDIGYTTPEINKIVSSDDFTRAYITKINNAKRQGLTDEADQIQNYNGRGKVFPSTEAGYHGFNMKNIYGVPVPQEGINMKQNPLYGKRILDLRDNVIKGNPQIADLVNEIQPYNLDKYSNGGRLATKYAEGGEVKSTPQGYVAPEVKVTGFKDNQTQAFFDRIRDLQPDDNNIAERLIALGQKHGNPDVMMYNTPQLLKKSEIAGRANYSPITNRMSLSEADVNKLPPYPEDPANIPYYKKWQLDELKNQYLSELSHAEQSKRNYIGENIGGFVDLGKRLIEGEGDIYDDPSSGEYQAHRIIQPELEAEYQNMYLHDKNPELFKRLAQVRSQATTTHAYGGQLMTYKKKKMPYGGLADGYDNGYDDDIYSTSGRSPLLPNATGVGVSSNTGISQPQAQTFNTSINPNQPIHTIGNNPTGILNGGVQVAKGFGATSYMTGTQAGIAGAANFAGDALQTIKPNSGLADIGGGALKGAAQGAAIGSFFSPAGTVIGGAVGAVAGTVGGIFSHNAKQKALKQQLAAQATAQNQLRSQQQKAYETGVVNNYNTSGNSAAGNGLYAHGGFLEPQTNRPVYRGYKSMASKNYPKMALGGEYVDYEMVGPGDPIPPKKPVLPQLPPTYDPSLLAPNGQFMVQKAQGTVLNGIYNDTGQWGYDLGQEHKVNFVPQPLSQKALGTDNNYNAARNQQQRTTDLPMIKPSSGYHAYGGTMKYADGGAIPLATDVQKFVGPSHAQGGIPIDPNGDGVPEAEVEGDEVQKDNQVYSDRLSPSPQLQMLLQQNKINTKGTYADIATKLGTMKGKYETKVASYSPQARRTGKAMGDRMEDLLNATFQDQEVTKPVYAQGQKFGDGGQLDGGDKRTPAQVAYDNYLLNKTMSTRYNPGEPLSTYQGNKKVPLVAPQLPSGFEEYQDTNGDFKLRPAGSAPQPSLGNGFQTSNPNALATGNAANMFAQPDYFPGLQRTTANGIGGSSGSWDSSGAPISAPLAPRISASTPLVRNRATTTSPYTGRKSVRNNTIIPNAVQAGIAAPTFSGQPIATNPLSGTPVTIGNNPVSGGQVDSVNGLDTANDLINRYGADVLNGLGYLNNQSQINKMKAPTFQAAPAPRYAYTDRSGLAKNENAIAAKYAAKGVANTSNQGRRAEQAAIYAQQIAGNNQINNQEGARHDAYDEQYNQRVLQNQYTNTDIANRQADVNTQVGNEKIAMGIQNRNAFTQGEITNQAGRKQEDLDREKALTILASTQDPDKALNLLSKFMNPAQAKRLQQLYRKR